MNYVILVISILFSGKLFSQDDETYCFDLKVGLLQTETYSGNFSKKVNTVGDRGNLNYPFVSMPYTIGRGQSSILYAPYLNLGMSIRYNPYFELNIGFSYTQIKSNLQYYDFTTENLSSSSLFYSRYVSNANGKLNNNIYRIEFAPVYRIFNTKIIFGFINIDISKSKTKFEGTKTKYDVVHKQNSWNNDHQYHPYPEDSIVTEVSFENIKPIYNIKDRLYFPLSIGVEQEIPFKKIRYLVGVKCIYSKRSYAPFSFLAYVGIRLSTPYTWKE